MCITFLEIRRRVAHANNLVLGSKGDDSILEMLGRHFTSRLLGSGSPCANPSSPNMFPATIAAGKTAN
jgi:hypothetical protein